MFKKLLSVSLLLSASLSLAMDEEQKPIITLGSIHNGIIYPMEGGYLSCHMKTTHIASVNPGATCHVNKELFTRKAGIRELTFAPHHPIAEGFRSYHLQLEMQAAALKITKDFGAEQDRPEETHPLEIGKKYLLNVTFHPGAGDNTVVAVLVEDNN